MSNETPEVVSEEMEYIHTSNLSHINDIAHIPTRVKVIAGVIDLQTKLKATEDIEAALRTQLTAALTREKEMREAAAKLCDEYAERHAKGDDNSKAQAWMMLQCGAAIRKLALQGDAGDWRGE